MAPTLIILFAIAMMLGPIMLMRPSVSQTRLAKLRTRAQELGMRIRMDRNPFEPASRSLAVYYLPFAKKKKGVPKFSLFRKNYAHDIHFYREWDWHKQAELSENQQAVLREVLKGLPQGVVGVESNQVQTGLFWNERTSGQSDEQALQTLLSNLQTLRDLL